jgi:hypothetical protein
LKARVRVAVTILVIVVLALAFSLVVLSIPAQLLELPALGHLMLGTLMEWAGQILKVFKLLVVFVRLLRLVHAGKCVVGSSLFVVLSTLIAPRIIAPIILRATWESFTGTLFKCNHLLYCTLEFLSGFWVVITEFFKLPLVFDPIGEVIYHLPIYDIIDLGS